LPRFEFLCEDEHLTELKCKSYDECPTTLTCDVEVEGRECGKPAKKIISKTAAIFQPWAFQNGGYASYNDRKRYFTDADCKDMGASHREAKAERPNRDFTRYGRGVAAKRVRTLS
jgi:hypothetical protein